VRRNWLRLEPIAIADANYSFPDHRHLVAAMCRPFAEKFIGAGIFVAAAWIVGQKRLPRLKKSSGADCCLANPAPEL